MSNKKISQKQIAEYMALQKALNGKTKPKKKKAKKKAKKSNTALDVIGLMLFLIIGALAFLMINVDGVN